MAKFILFAQTPPRIPAEEVSQGACVPPVLPRISASAGRGNPKKVGAKTQGEEAAGARLLVGSLRRARAWLPPITKTHSQNRAAPAALAPSRPAGRLEKNISYTYTHTPRDYVPARGESSAAFRTKTGRKERRSVSQVNHQKFCRHRARRPFGKTNRLSIIDGDEKRKGRRQSPAWTSSTRSPIFCASARAA